VAREGRLKKGRAIDYIALGQTVIHSHSFSEYGRNTKSRVRQKKTVIKRKVGVGRKKNIEPARHSLGGVYATPRVKRTRVRGDEDYITSLEKEVQRSTSRTRRREEGGKPSLH